MVGRILVRQVEAEHLVVPERGGHVLVPDRDREGRACDRARRARRASGSRPSGSPSRRPWSAAGCSRRTRRPRGSRSSLSCRRSAWMPSPEPAPVPYVRVLPQHVVDLPGDALRERPLRLRLAPAGARVDLAARQDHLRDRHRLRVDAHRREGRVGRGHVERRNGERARARSTRPGCRATSARPGGAPSARRTAGRRRASAARRRCCRTAASRASPTRSPQ